MDSRVVVAALAACLVIPGEVSSEELPSHWRASSCTSVGRTHAASIGLRLAWLDVTGGAIGLGGIAQAEAASVFARLGVDVAWRRSAASEAGRCDEVRVILVDRLVVNPATGRLVLGSTPEGRRASPFVWIHVPSVAAAVGLGPRRSVYALSLEQRRDLGLAVGRVVAHEVVHAVAGGVPHGHGVMSDTLNRRRLTAPRLSFEPTVAGALRAALLGVPPPRARLEAPTEGAGGATR